MCGITWQKDVKRSTFSAPAYPSKKTLHYGAENSLLDSIYLVENFFGGPVLNSRWSKSNVFLNFTFLGKI